MFTVCNSQEKENEKKKTILNLCRSCSKNANNLQIRNTLELSNKQNANQNFLYKTKQKQDHELKFTTFDSLHHLAKTIVKPFTLKSRAFDYRVLHICGDSTCK